MENHIISDCQKIDRSIREAVIYMVEAREREIYSDANANKRQNTDDQTTLENFYEKNSRLSKERKEDINTALIKAFVCCGLP